jgi:hypothetical protein
MGGAPEHGRGPRGGEPEEIRTAIQLKEILLEDWHSPDRKTLIQELAERRVQANAGPRRRRPAA